MKKFIQAASVWMWIKWSLVKQEEGQGLVEYGLIIALVAIVMIAALGVLTGGLNGVFSNIANKL